jgi:hypothetical protein
MRSLISASQSVFVSMASLCVALCLSASPFAQTSARASSISKDVKPSDAPVQVMILGVYHFDNPGLDVANMAADDVTKPRRQKELAQLTEQLARFAPTKVMVEMVPSKDSATIPAYEKFTPADLLKDKNEITQIGFRLAHRMKHSAVYAIDEQSDTVNYFPFQKLQAYAKAQNVEPALNAITARWQAQVKTMEADQKTKTIGQMLRSQNEPAKIISDQQQYAALLQFGSGTEWPGAELNAAWFLRNAKIHSKLMKLAEPGDRIVVIYGAGHNYALRDWVKTTPNYRLVEPNAYLR